MGNVDLGASVDTGVAFVMGQVRNIHVRICRVIVRPMMISAVIKVIDNGVLNIFSNPGLLLIAPVILRAILYLARI